MKPGRIMRLAEAFAAQPSGPGPMRLCAATSKLVDAAGVGLSVGTSHGLLDTGLHSVCATDAGQDGEALQFDLGEGPSHTAHQTGWPVQAPDLECDGIWPAFSAAATRVGLRAVFAFPLRSGSTSQGALTLYQHVAGELTSDQYADALIASRFALTLLTERQAGRPPDELDAVFSESLSNSIEVHQASGIVSVQLGIPVADALAVIRAHAFAEACSLAEVAKQVIDRRLKLGPLSDELP
ncbi:MAG: ANTAR domain-containing protein [Egicoccus sp.]